MQSACGEHALPSDVAHSSMSPQTVPSPVKPWRHEHSNEPRVLAQSANLWHVSTPRSHSFISRHTSPVPVQPASHSQAKLPLVLMHEASVPHVDCVAHSSTSVQDTPSPIQPALHEQVKEPPPSVHVACASQLLPPMGPHSGTSVHTVPVMPWKPGSHAHVNEPRVLVHCALAAQSSVPRVHSSMSVHTGDEPCEVNPRPHGLRKWATSAPGWQLPSRVMFVIWPADRNMHVEMVSPGIAAAGAKIVRIADPGGVAKAEHGDVDTRCSVPATTESPVLTVMHHCDVATAGSTEARNERSVGK
mmetsp:Transcript_34866/g.105095  ORF Transcript_34866/g.105095 Transcript_34866/m.105095 type:complete len:302 (-) Transcript_34866:1652-2557(-)